MKNILRILALAAVLACSFCFQSCKGRRGALLPNISGKAGEIIVVIEKNDWEGTLGSSVRELLAGDCPYLASKEPLYTLVNVTPGGFADLFKVHRNIILFDIDAQVAKSGISYMQDKWAAPQCLINIAAHDREEAISLFRDGGPMILSTIEQAERDRVIRNSLRYEQKDIAPQVAEVFGGSPHIPIGYQLKKKTSDFVWIADEKQKSIQGILIYKYPAGKDAGAEFKMENIIARRNAVMRTNVPGMFDNTWMTTSTQVTPSLEYIRYRGRQFAQLRGYWEVQNDFMGGPFVSHSFYSPDGASIIVAEAFVYAPSHDKRQFLRQAESILYSWEWNNDAKGEN